MTTDTPLQVRMLAALDRMEAAPGTARAAAIERMRGWLSLHATHSACEVYRRCDGIAQSQSSQARRGQSAK